MSHVLYSFPFSCSLSVQILLRQIGVPFETRSVQRGVARKANLAALTDVNPKRKVPTLVLPDGEVLTEIVSVLTYLEHAHDPVDAAASRRRLEWVSFLATELHQQVLGPTFDDATPQEAVEDAKSRLLPPVLETLEAELDQEGTLGSRGADAYLLWAVLLLGFRCPEQVAAPAFQAFQKRMFRDEHVRSVVAENRDAHSATV